MPRTSFKTLQCPIAQFAEAVGDKWSLLIVRDAFMGVTTFSGFQRNLGLAKNVLTERLNHLVEHEILKKNPTRPGVNRYVYELTEKGLALRPVAKAMSSWSQTWVPRLASSSPDKQRDAHEQ